MDASSVGTGVGPATILIAVGGIIPAITSGLNRFGQTCGFFVGELLGVVFLFAGFLVSVEVFRRLSCCGPSRTGGRPRRRGPA